MSRALALALLATLSGCAAPQTENRAVPEPEILIRGALAFRVGMEPPPGSVATVAVADFADDSAAPVATTSIRVENPRVMLPFELSVPLSGLDPGRQYVVRAGLSSPRSEARWSTDIGQIIDATRAETDVGVLLMSLSRDDVPDPELN